MDDVYSESDVVSRVMKTGRLFFFDLDGSLAAGKVAIRKDVRYRADSNGATVFATARTPELTLSSATYEQSSAAGFPRPKPKVGVNPDGTRYWIPLEENPLDDHKHMLDATATIGFGTGIWIRKKEVYVQDETAIGTTFAEKYFRSTTLHLLKCADKIDLIKPHLAQIEIPDAYERNMVDVAPLEYRIQLDFSKLDDKLRAIELVTTLKESHFLGIRDMAKHICLVDESSPDKLDKMGNLAPKFTLYLMPSAATKQALVKHFLDQVIDAANSPRSELEVLYVGDSLTDIPAGLQSSAGTKATFLLVGGSRLSRYLTIPGIETFAGEDLRPIKRLIVPMQRPGFYRFQDTQFIIADEAYQGTVGAESVLAYMDEVGIT